MTIDLNMRIHQDIPEAVVNRLQHLTRIFRGDVTVYGVEKVDWEEVFNVLEANGIADDDVRVMFTEARKYHWNRLHNEAVAAVLDAYDAQGDDNLPEDFDPESQSKHVARLLPGKPARASAKPSGHLAAIGNELAFSRSLVGALGGMEVGWNAGDVEYRGKKLDGWLRFKPKEQCSIISSALWRPPVKCVVCGEPLIPTSGIWIAEPNASFTARFAEDTVETGHYGIEHPLVISLDQAAELAQRFCKYSFTLEPVYCADSPYAQLIARIMSRVEQISRSA